jgi:hypothetical protein
MGCLARLFLRLSGRWTVDKIRPDMPMTARATSESFPWPWLRVGAYQTAERGSAPLILTVCDVKVRGEFRARATPPNVPSMRA